MEDKTTTELRKMEQNIRLKGRKPLEEGSAVFGQKQTHIGGERRSNVNFNQTQVDAVEKDKQ